MDWEYLIIRGEAAKSRADIKPVIFCFQFKPIKYKDKQAKRFKIPKPMAGPKGSNLKSQSQKNKNL